jgi:hypothetical protein
MIEVLKHHVESVKEYFSSITDIDEAIFLSREVCLPKLKDSRLLDGSKAYPNIDEDQMIENLAHIIVAINTGNYVEKTERDNTRWLNKDLICEACGNLERTGNSEDRIMCGAYRKEEIIVNKVLKKLDNI